MGTGEGAWTCRYHRERIAYETLEKAIESEGVTLTRVGRYATVLDLMSQGMEAKIKTVDKMMPFLVSVWHGVNELPRPKIGEYRLVA